LCLRHTDSRAIGATRRVLQLLIAVVQ
jgi:hypothetical protein